MENRFFKYPWIIIIAALILTVGFATQLGKLEIENSLRIYLPVEHEAFTRLEEMEAMFGGTETIGIVLEAQEGSILTSENIALLGDITTAIEALNDVHSVMSLTNIDYMYGEEGSLISAHLVDEGFSGTEEEVAAIKERIVSWDDMYYRVIISDDWKSTQMSVTLKTNLGSQEKQAVLAQVRQIVTGLVTDPTISTTFIGDPVVTESAGDFMRSDLSHLIPLVVLVVILTLFLSFGGIEGTVLPLATVLMSSIWSLGIMGMMGISFTIISSIIPVALIAIGSAYGIHVMNHYYAAMEEVGGPITTEQHRRIILSGLNDVLPAVLLAAITTIAGFLSLVRSPLVPLRSFSVFTALGVFFSLLLSITVVPALLMIKPEQKIGRRSRILVRLKARLKRSNPRLGESSSPSAGETAEEKEKQNSLYRIYLFLASNPLRLALFSLAIIVVSLIGIHMIVVDTALINYFPANSQLRRDIDFVDERFAGTNSLYLIVEGEEKGSLNDPAILQPMDELQAYLAETYGEIGKVVSFPTFVKRMNQVLHIPEDPEQYVSSWDDAYEEELSFSFFDDDPFGAFDDYSYADDPEDAFIDPNIAYSERLHETMTVQDGLALLAKVYAAAGGRTANAEEMVRLLEREFNYDGAAYYEIPHDLEKYPVATDEELQDLVSQYLLLFSGSLDSFIDDPLVPQTARVAIQLRTRSTTVIANIMRDAEKFAAARFPEGYTIHATGNAHLENIMTDLIVSSQLQSLLFSLVSVFLILTLYFKSPLSGLVGIAPLFFAILLNYMAMGIFHINLDLFTSLIASIAVGVGIDYTIHFMTNYRKERLLSDDLSLVTLRTIEKSGRGIFINASSVGLGFLVLVFSRFVVLRYIGILAAVVMFTSSTLAMTIIPGLLNIFDFKFMRKKSGRSR